MNNGNSLSKNDSKDRVHGAGFQVELFLRVQLEVLSEFLGAHGQRCVNSPAVRLSKESHFPNRSGRFRQIRGIRGQRKPPRIPRISTN